jgi:5'-3' exonuclease
MFMRKIMTDLCYSLNQLPVNGHVIFCKDSRSWRKDLKIERADYKGSRVKDEKVDWGSFFDLMDEFGKFLELNGYIYSKSNGAEGDDLLWFWNQKLRGLGHNVVVYSGDKDSHQLVGCEDTWTICWNANSKNNKIYCANNWKEDYLDKERETSIFNLDFAADTEKDKMVHISSSATLEFTDPIRLTFEKILTGDKGDDVPSVFSYEKTPGKIFKLTKAKAESIYESFKQSGWGNSRLEDVWKDDEFKDWIKKITFQEIISSAYVDTSDYDSPVHYFLDDIWISLDPSRSIIYPTFFKKVYLNLDDDFSGLTMMVAGHRVFPVTPVPRYSWGDVKDATPSRRGGESLREH